MNDESVCPKCGSLVDANAHSFWGTTFHCGSRVGTHGKFVYHTLDKVCHERQISDLTAQLAAAEARVKELEGEVERLKGRTTKKPKDYGKCRHCGANGGPFINVHAPKVKYPHITVYDCGSWVEGEYTQSEECKRRTAALARPANQGGEG
jgi:hypothetical protein